MINRYENRTVFKNDLSEYEKYFRDRHVKFIRHYNTPNFRFGDESILNEINITKHVWQIGDKYYKLADKYYGDSKDWWIIARFNNKPTEAHLKIGDELLIPVPIYKLLNYMLG